MTKTTRDTIDPMAALNQARQQLATAQQHRAEAERDYEAALTMQPAESLDQSAEKRLRGEALDLSDRNAHRDERIREARARRQVADRELQIATTRLHTAELAASKHVCREQAEADRADTRDAIQQALTLIGVLCRMIARRDAIQAQRLSPTYLPGELPLFAWRYLDMHFPNYGELGTWLKRCQEAGFGFEIPKAIDGAPIREAQHAREAQMQQQARDLEQQEQRERNQRARERQQRQAERQRQSEGAWT
ncbi:MAG TPA: hypothetical protein VGM03_22535 [Phycisphaerae bacterium]|jgi:hypothetical protein